MKKVREGCKMTELGEIPEEWSIGKLNDICQVRSEKYNPVNNLEKDYIALEHIEQGIGRINRIGKSTETTSMKSIFQKGDILFGKLRPYLRKYWYAEFDGVCATEILPLITNKKCDSRFCYYIIQQDNFIEYVDKGSFGTKMPRTSWNEMKEFLIPIPSLKEQEKISSILSSVDEQIEITDNLIEKTKELKKGLMQRLLTKGIGHSIFKNTEIGRIPEEWKVKRLNDISAEYNNSIVDGPFGSNLKTCDYTDEGILVMQSNYITGGKFELRDVRYISEDKAKELVRSKTKSGDILMAKIGANFGMSEIIPEGIRYGVLSSNSLKIDLNDKIAINEFYLFILKLFKQNGTIDKLASITAQPALSLKAIKELKVPVPTLNEQKQIALILSSVDEQIDQYESKREKLQELKRGLMQKLLTGEIRVKVN